MMKRVHSAASPDVQFPDGGDQPEKPIALTVWKKSLLFNCSGFTVFDSQGRLVFRVDNYVTDNKLEEIVLMDGSGMPLLTMKRKKLSLGYQWQVFRGEPKGNSCGSPKPIYSVKKKATIMNPKSLAHVHSGASCKRFLYAISGSYTKRSCQVVNTAGRVVAEVRMKEASSGGVNYTDVFRLIVQPEFDVSFAMAMVLLLDQMCSSKWSPVLL